MKKLFSLLIVAAMAGTASAASIDWTLKGSSFTTSDGSATRAADYLVVAILASDLDSAVSAISTVNTDSSAFESYVKSSGTTAKTGATSGSFTVSQDSGVAIPLVLIAFDAKNYEDATHYLVSGTESGTTYEPPATPVTATFNSTSYSGKSWVAIPEPSVALMGLLGLGMLLKRRRA